MRKKSIIRFTMVFLAAASFPWFAWIAGAQALTPIESLGKLVMFDKQLSLRNNQSCASCHDPMVGFTGPIPGINRKGAVYFGSDRQKFGNRKPPSAAYATTSPLFDYDIDEDLFFGGNFWDGRATGWDLGNPAADQAKGPFLNPVEQALPEKLAVVEKVCASYGALFEDLFGAGSCDLDSPGIIDAAYDNVAVAVAAYENSAEVNQFSSKYDAVAKGQASFTKIEQKGWELFKGDAKCSLCHIMSDPPNIQDLFTDYTFDNLGVPKNPENPVYKTDPGFIDYGLGDFLRVLSMDDAWRSAKYVTDTVNALSEHELKDLADLNDGKHKVPTLRNVDKKPGKGYAKSYGHNGYHKTLEGFVHFYNTRDTKPVCPGDYTEKEALATDCWPEPEVKQNVNDDELGNLGLKPADEKAIVEFLKTLSDGYQP